MQVENKPRIETSSQTVPSWSAEDLTQGGATARIKLGEAEYVLRITRASKLILTK
ncbi:hemin uptake protein HemP [Sedimentitalea nanhaiensis]|uniref:Hemin uptake protein HemP n=1 Tax=Sedimentitalea nanhaiensis TaxID=999627 RepID=A0A1I7CJ99_9RHOB|nr:hemin uptake protein HemP [Sedimentitalea nanhaiensis]SFT99454.1 Hemin uptake protein HemP [Sedimentitalea nanhaiensis]